MSAVRCCLSNSRPRLRVADLAHTRVQPPHTRSVRCCSQLNLDLEPWQRRRLEAAAKLGKGKAEIKKLAGDTQLSREEVLTFLKWWRSLPENTKESFTEATIAAEQASVERKAIRDSKKAERSQQAWRTFQEVNDLKREHKRAGKGPLNRRQISLLEKVYEEQSRRPSDALVSEICRLEGLERKAVTQWFEQRRSQR